MAISLTKDEFLKRFDERCGILKIAIKHDLKLRQQENISEDDFIASAAADAISRVIDAVYDESF